jgi:outer membrane receptor protein involved in Fe transport
MNKFLGFVPVLLFPVWVTAQKSAFVETDSAHRLQEVIVTATKQPATFLQTPYSYNKISTEQISDFQFRTTPEALSGAAGVFVQKTNHGGGSPFVRGLTGNQNLLMIDGIRLNNSTYRYGPNQYFNTVDIYNLQSIEVVRGTGSVQYGSDAMGGVIQVFTKDAQFADKPKWGATIYGKAVSSAIEYSGRAEVSYQRKKIAFQGGYTARNFGDLPGGSATGVQSPSGYNEQSYDLKLKLALNSSTVLTMTHQQLVQRDVPLYHKVKLENFKYSVFDPQVRTLSYLRLDKTTRIPLLSKIALIASAQQNREERKYMKNGAANKFEEKDKINTLGLTADIYSVLSKRWTANSGVEYYHDKVYSSKEQITIASGAVLAQRGLYPDQASTGNFSVYSLHHISLNRFQVEAGLRYNKFAIRIEDTSGSVYKLGKVTVRPESLVANFSLLYNLTTNQTVYASFSTGYRAPNIDDMGTLGLVDFRYEVPAYGLRPEKSYNTEIGYRYSGNRWKASLSIFNMQLTDLITRVQVPGHQVGGYNVYVKENSQESYLRGAETELQYKVSGRLLVETSASYAYGQNTSKNEPLRRVPPFNGRTALTYKTGKFRYTIEHTYAAAQHRLAQGDIDDNRIGAAGTAGWYLLNLYAGGQFGPLSVRTGFMNVFNADYRTHGSGINGAGRNLFVGFSIKI